MELRDFIKTTLLQISEAIKDRVKFLSYDSLDKQYNQELQKSQFDFVL